MSDDELQAIFTYARRRQRREAVLLILVSCLFVVVGLIMLIGAGLIAGLFVAVFFAAGIVAGSMQLVGMGTRRGLLLGITAAVLLTFACGLLVVMTLTGIVIDAPGRSQLIATIAAAVGVVFFGGGSVVLIVRFGRRYR